MAITPVQQKIDNTNPHKSYRDAKNPIKTNGNIKPLPPEGHLVHDTLLSVPKYFIKDIAYDMKAVKDGFQGNANDHQLGRLNDVGLKLGGVGIATVLAANTANPVARIMEYAGLGAFLAAMTLYPKIAINAPSRLVQGFDIGKEYIDDQGRKKSVLQDPNYIPIDMYQGEYPGEDLDIIGDRLGIPRDIKNRNDMIKEQMRKIGIQNNTLWMMTAGVVPVFSALLCCGLEKLIGPAVEKSRNSFYNTQISKLLDKTSNMTDEIEHLPHNKLSKEIEKTLVNYKNQELPAVELDNIIRILSKDLDDNAANGIKDDLNNIFSTQAKGEKAYLIKDNFANELSNSLKLNISSRNTKLMDKIFTLEPNEINDILKKVNTKQVTEEELLSLKGEFKNLFDKRIELADSASRPALKVYEHEVLENISSKIKASRSNLVSEDSIRDVVNLAKVLGEFKTNQKALDKCKLFKVEYASETVLARSYAKFESTLLDALDIKYKELKQISESETIAQEILEKKLEALVQDENKYNRAVDKLSKVMSEMEVNLNGKDKTAAYMKDLITGIENNYNNTAIRLDKIGKFKNTIDKLVKEDISTLSNSLKSKDDLYKLLDGTQANQFSDFNYWKAGVTDDMRLNYARQNSKGVGSSKNLEISRIIERYQGANNSLNRVLHLLDVYKRPTPNGNYDKEILKKGKEAVLKATSPEHTLKLNTINNPEYYKDLIKTIWSGKLEKSTNDVLKHYNDTVQGNIADRFVGYINRFRNIIGNNNIDFTKPQHLVGGTEINKYTKSSKTRMAKFNLIAQSPLDMVMKASGRRYGNQKWLRIVSTIGATVFGTAVLAQFCFGKVRNPQNVQRQVEDDTDN